MEKKRIQIEQLQNEISRCKEAEIVAAEAENRCEDTEEALQSRVTKAEETLEDALQELQEVREELQRAEERCTQVTRLLEQATWSPAKDIKWTTDGTSVSTCGQGDGDVGYRDDSSAYTGGRQEVDNTTARRWATGKCDCGNSARNKTRCMRPRRSSGQNEAHGVNHEDAVVHTHTNNGSVGSSSWGTG